MGLPNKIVKVYADLKIRTAPGAILKCLPKLLKALASEKKTFPYVSKLKRESANREPHSGVNWNEDLESDPVILYGFLVFLAQYSDFEPLMLPKVDGVAQNSSFRPFTVVDQDLLKTDEETKSCTQHAQVTGFFSNFAEPDPDQIFAIEPPYSAARLLQLVDIFLGMVSVGINDKSLQGVGLKLEINKEDHWRTKAYQADLITLIPLFEQVRRDHATPDKVPRSKLIPVVKALVKQRGIILNNATESLYEEASQQGDYRKRHPRGLGHS